MEAKVPNPPNVPPQSIIQDMQVPGNPVIFKSENSAKANFHIKSPNLKIVLASFVMVFLVGGVGVGVYLVGQQQQIKSRASSNDIVPKNLSAIVPQNVVNQTATPSAKTPLPSSQTNNQSTESSTLTNITIPELDSSLSASINSSESATLIESYDFNNDSAANSIDMSIMYAGWGTPKNDQQKKADLNGDGIINGIDYSIFLPNFNKPI